MIRLKLVWFFALFSGLGKTDSSLLRSVNEIQNTLQKLVTKNKILENRIEELETSCKYNGRKYRLDFAFVNIYLEFAYVYNLRVNVFNFLKQKVFRRFGVVPNKSSRHERLSFILKGEGIRRFIFRDGYKRGGA